jgi:N-acetylglucosamine-6-phosphate deacetylase
MTRTMADEQVHIAFRGTALINRQMVTDAVVFVHDGRISAIGPHGDVDLPANVRVIDAADQCIAPGFVDIHIHGSGGCRAEEDAPGMARHVVRNGTTYFLPTLISNELPAMLDAIDHIRAHVGPVKGGATIGGVHLEGPFLNPKYGAQRPETNIEPDAKSVRTLIDRCGDTLRIVTIAPERPGAIEAIEAFAAADAVVAMGHSDADEDEYRKGRRAGITHATHLLNAMPPKGGAFAPVYNGLHEIGPAHMVLADKGVTADIIADMNGEHVSSTWLRIALACKGADKLSLMTDAMVCAGLPPGAYEMADGQRIQAHNGEDIVRLANGDLCGSALSMCGALRNFMNHTDVPLETALTMVSEAPARVLKLFDRKGSLAPGKDADIVLLDADHNVASVFIAGVEVFSRD